MRLGTMAAGAATMLVLSGLGAVVIDRLRTTEADPTEAAVSDTTPDGAAASTTLTAPAGPTAPASTSTVPATALRPPVVTFQAAGGQAVVSGTVPTDDVYQGISTAMTGLYGAENVVLTSIIVDQSTAPALWMDSTDQLVGSLGAFDDYRLRFDGETLTGFVGGGNFDSASSELPPGYDPILTFIADVMSRDSSLTLLIEGHTDSVGEDAYNLQLSQSRAEAVLGRLVERGVDAGRLSAEGRGEFNPTAPNDTAEGRARNRRVQLTLSVGAAG